MTNMEKLSRLPPEDFWKRVSEISECSLEKYIDVPAWLCSTDKDISHFVKAIGACLVRPSWLEILICGGRLNETEADMYAATHSKKMLLLEKHTDNVPYAVVADIDNMSAVKIHKSQIRYLNKKE